MYAAMGSIIPMNIGNCPMKRNIKAFVYADGDGFVAESSDVNVVTQGDSLEETLANLREAVGLALDGEDLAQWDLAPNPTLLVTIEMEPLRHAG